MIFGKRFFNRRFRNRSQPSGVLLQYKRNPVDGPPELEDCLQVLLAHLFARLEPPLSAAQVKNRMQLVFHWWSPHFLITTNSILALLLLPRSPKGISPCSLHVKARLLENLDDTRTTSYISGVASLLHRKPKICTHYFYNQLSLCFDDLWTTFSAHSIPDITPTFITFFYITHSWLWQP